MKALLLLDPGDHVMGIAILTLLQSTAVIALAWLLAGVAARRRPAVRHAIWLGALLSLLLGPLAAIAADRAGLSLPLIDLRGFRAVVASVSPATTAVPPVGDAPSVLDSARPDWVSRLPIPAPGDALAREVVRPAVDRTSAEWLRAACGLAFLVWGVGAIVLMVRLVAGALHLGRLKRRAAKFDQAASADVLAEVRAALGMRALPPLLVSDALDRPVAAGIFRAVVVLPKASFESLDPRRLRDVLVHECAHVARRDHLVGLLQRVAEVVFWPQPLLRLLDRELSRAREEICDNHVLRGGDRIAYAWTLLEAAEMADGPAPLSSAFGLLSSSWRLEDRIAGILDDGRDLMTHSNRRASILVTACFLATTAAFAGLAPAEDDPADGKGVSGAVDRMAEQLRQGPFERTPDDERAGLYLLDLADGKSTLITDEPAPGLTNCGSPRWSPDGRRILFDASPGKNWRETHMKSIDLGEDRLKITDLGFGNCPSFSPDGKEIAFLSNNDEGMGLAGGIWIMKAEGQSRWPLDVDGSPQWSPDGRKILVVHFGSPVQSSILDVETGAETPLNFPGYRIHPSPRWAGPDTVVAAATSDEGTAIALFDVSNPDEAKVKEVLWKKGDRLDADPMYPVFSPATGRCVFVGKTDEGRALYSVQRGSFGPPRRAEERGFDGRLAGLEFSPDGRFLLYCSDRSPIKTP